MRVKRGSSNLSLVFILFCSAQVEFKSSEFNHSKSTLWHNKPIRAASSPGSCCWVESQGSRASELLRHSRAQEKRRVSRRGLPPADTSSWLSPPPGRVTTTKNLPETPGPGLGGVLPIRVQGCSPASASPRTPQRDPHTPSFGRPAPLAFLLLPPCFPRVTSTAQTHLSGLHISLKDWEYGSVFQTDRLTV